MLAPRIFTVQVVPKAAPWSSVMGASEAVARWMFSAGKAAVSTAPMVRIAAAPVSRADQRSLSLGVRTSLRRAPVGQAYLQNPCGTKRAATNPTAASVSGMRVAAPSAQASNGSQRPRFMPGHTSAARKATASSRKGRAERRACQRVGTLICSPRKRPSSSCAAPWGQRWWQ